MARKKKSKKSSKSVNDNTVVIKTDDQGVKFIGAYRLSIPAPTIRELKKKSNTVTIEKKHLQFLVEETYTEVKETEKPEQTKEEAPNTEGDSDTKKEDE